MQYAQKGIVCQLSFANTSKLKTDVKPWGHPIFPRSIKGDEFDLCEISIRYKCIEFQNAITLIVF